MNDSWKVRKPIPTGSCVLLLHHEEFLCLKLHSCIIKCACCLSNLRELLIWISIMYFCGAASLYQFFSSQTWHCRDWKIGIHLNQHYMGLLNIHPALNFSWIPFKFKTKVFWVQLWCYIYFSLAQSFSKGEQNTSSRQ